MSEPVRHVMTRNPASCTPQTKLQEVAKMMVQHDCGCIPVLDASGSGTPVGTITDRDITCRTGPGKESSRDGCSGLHDLRLRYDPGRRKSQ
jgi:CBS domain-containing protein